MEISYVASGIQEVRHLNAFEDLSLILWAQLLDPNSFFAHAKIVKPVGLKLSTKIYILASKYAA